MDLYYFFLSYKRNQKEKDIYIEESPITEMYNYRTITSNLNETLWYYFFNFDQYMVIGGHTKSKLKLPLVLHINRCRI